MTATTTLHVEGMTCGGCENNVQFALNGLDGVTTVKANHETNTVVVDYDTASIALDTLGEAIESMGYTLVTR